MMPIAQAAHDENDSGTARVIVRPPLLLLGALLLGSGSDHLMPLPRPLPGPGLVHSISAVIAGLLALIGIAVFVAAIRGFWRAETPVPSTKPARALVTTGIYGWSRNPIYLGMLLFFVGIGIAVRSPWILMLALPLALILRYAVIAREETYLEVRFGQAYRDYRARVRRWL
jgi:protein-S-isoprenylcysteine O-methyltransferase Ste14